MQLTTTDLYESSFLHCRGVELARAWVDRGRRRETVVFVFEGDDLLPRLQTEYRTGEAIVNLTEYRASFDELKALMFALIRSSKRPLENQNHNRKGRVRHDPTTLEYQAVNH